MATGHVYLISQSEPTTFMTVISDEPMTQSGDSSDRYNSEDDLQMERGRCRAKKSFTAEVREGITSETDESTIATMGIGKKGRFTSETDDSSIVTLETGKSCETLSHPLIQLCPLCAAPMCRNYDPRNLQPSADLTKSIHVSTPVCSLTLPLEDMLNKLMGRKTSEEPTATSNPPPGGINGGDYFYCIRCRTYVVRDELELKKEIDQKQKQIMDLEKQKAAEIRKVEAELKRQMIGLNTQYKLKIEEMEAHRYYLEAHHNKKITEMQDQQKEIELIKQNQEKQISALLAKVYHGEDLRRNLHNHLQELRGNIRVFVRTRPFIKQDNVKDDKSSPILNSADHEHLSIQDSRMTKTHDFKFDRVFDPSGGQEDIFVEVSDFVQSSLDGYNVCLFSYGQTGSGKTYTMQGGTAYGDDSRGIIPRAVEKILHQIKSLENANWSYTMHASFLEIYNEELRDLLSREQALSSESPTKLSIKRPLDGRAYVENLSKHEIDTNDPDKGMEDLSALMSEAVHNRAVACTKMSHESSRSHAVFMIELQGCNSDTGTSVTGTLNLCDLAGSERLDRSGTGSDAVRLRETKNINRSLSALGTVFNALRSKASHVPYRNSKLTYLLQDCLSGDGKALMFVNLSPTQESRSETLCSLRFAQQVRQVSFGKLKRNVAYSNKR